MTDKVKFFVHDMHCQKCADKVKHALESELKEAKAAVNIHTKEVELTTEHKLDHTRIERIISDIGYKADFVN